MKRTLGVTILLFVTIANGLSQRHAGVASSTGLEGNSNRKGGANYSNPTYSPPFNTNQNWAAPLQAYQRQLQREIDDIDAGSESDGRAGVEAMLEDIRRMKEENARQLAAIRAKMTPAQRRAWDEQVAAARLKSETEQNIAKYPGYRRFPPLRLKEGTVNSAGSVGYGIPVGAAIKTEKVGVKGQPDSIYIEVWNFTKMPIRVYGLGGWITYVAPNSTGKFPVVRYVAANPKYRRPHEAEITIEAWAGRSPSIFTRMGMPKVTNFQGGSHEGWNPWFERNMARQ